MRHLSLNLFVQEMARCGQIELNNKRLEAWRQKSEILLYAMIPKSIAIRLKNGESPVNTCQVSNASFLDFHRPCI